MSRNELVAQHFIERQAKEIESRFDQIDLEISSTNGAQRLALRSIFDRIKRLNHNELVLLSSNLPSGLSLFMGRALDAGEITVHHDMMPKHPSLISILKTMDVTPIYISDGSLIPRMVTPTYRTLTYRMMMYLRDNKTHQLVYQKYLDRGISVWRCMTPVLASVDHTDVDKHSLPDNDIDSYQRCVEQRLHEVLLVQLHDQFQVQCATLYELSRNNENKVLSWAPAFELVPASDDNELEFNMALRGIDSVRQIANDSSELKFTRIDDIISLYEKYKRFL